MLLYSPDEAAAGLNGAGAYTFIPLSVFIPVTGRVSSAAPAGPATGSAAAASGPAMTQSVSLPYDPSVYPFDTVVRITDTIAGQTWQGSGVLISPDEVLTASHLVYIQGEGAATNVVVTPGYNFGSSPYGSAYGAYIHYFQINDANGTISSDQSQYDYAVIHLSTSFSAAGYMGLQADFAGGQVNVTGYPGAGNGAQVNSVQTVAVDPTYTLLEGTSIGKGSSGGPVWIQSAGGPAVVGLVSSQATDNSGTGYNTLITTSVFNQIVAWVAQDDAASGGPAPTSSLIDSLNVNQQLELIYVAYFNRAADGGGFAFWGGQNTAAQEGGQSAATALTNIANSFAPQPETAALYPILSIPDLDLQSLPARTSLTTFINTVYSNLFGRTADSVAETYWLGELTSGAVGLGAAVLAIAGGAIGADAIELQNKIAVALDFTTRTQAAGLGGTLPLAASFVTVAHSVLNGVDGAALNDASVTAGMTATTAYIAGATTATMAAIPAGAASLPLAAGDLVTVSTSNSVIDRISGFAPAANDTLDLPGLLAAARLSGQDVLPDLGSCFSVADQGADAVLRFDPLGHGGSGAVPVLTDLGGVITGFARLSLHGGILS